MWEIGQWQKRRRASITVGGGKNGKARRQSVHLYHTTTSITTTTPTTHSPRTSLLLRLHLRLRLRLPLQITLRGDVAQAEDGQSIVPDLLAGSDTFGGALCVDVVVLGEVVGWVGLGGLGGLGGWVGGMGWVGNEK